MFDIREKMAVWHLLYNKMPSFILTLPEPFTAPSISTYFQSLCVLFRQCTNQGQ